MAALKQLAQLRPANTTAASLYSPPDNTSAVVECIVICNQSGANSSYRIFHDDNGTTYDETTALFWDIALSANTTDVLELNFGMTDTDGNLAVRSANANAITFTAYGRDQ